MLLELKKYEQHPNNVYSVRVGEDFPPNQYLTSTFYLPLHALVAYELTHITTNNHHRIAEIYTLYFGEQRQVFNSLDYEHVQWLKLTAFIEAFKKGDNHAAK